MELFPDKYKHLQTRNKQPAITIPAMATVRKVHCRLFVHKCQLLIKATLCCCLGPYDEYFVFVVSHIDQQQQHMNCCAAGEHKILMSGP